MTAWTLIRRSLRFHARAHLGVVLGAAIGSTALIGALIVGDSVKESLRERSLARLGPVHFALTTPDHVFRASLRERLGRAPDFGWTNLSGAGRGPSYIRSQYPFAAALLLRGIASAPDGSARLNEVNVIGVESPEWPRAAGWARLFGTNQLGVQARVEGTRMELKPGEGPLASWAAGESALVNDTLARRLKLGTGDEILFRVEKPSALGLEAAIAPRDQNSVALRLKIGAVLDREALGDFSLRAQQIPPANIFLPLDWLSAKLGAAGSANLIIAGAVEQVRVPDRWKEQRRRLARWGLGPGNRWKISGSPAPREGLIQRMARAIAGNREVAVAGDQGASLLDYQIQQAWLPEDAGLSVRTLEELPTSLGGQHIGPLVEVITSRVFFESSIAAAAVQPSTKLLTDRPDFENDTTNEVAFSSFVTNGFGVLTYLANLIRSGDRSTPYSMVTAAGAPYTPGDMRDDEILVNDWLAGDLQVKPGDQLELSYFVVDSGSRLTERTNAFRVRSIVPLQGVYADRTLMPEFPGVAKAETAHDWDAGFPLVYPIREKDEQYWRKYRGTPKAFIPLSAGQRMWGNRFGSLTAVRYAVPAHSSVNLCRQAVYRNLVANLDPASLGLRFEPVREQALQAAAQGQDFGQLFLGFSLFLVVSALLLMSLLFRFGLEQRATETGTFLALGFTARQVRRLFLAEGIGLAIVGGVLGGAGGIIYAKAMLWGLVTIWRSAVNAAALEFHASVPTLLIGFLASTIVAVLAIWATLRKQARRPAAALLAGDVPSPKLHVSTGARWLGLACGTAAASILAWSVARGEVANPGIFFGAGALLLLAGLFLAAAALDALATCSHPVEFTRARLAVCGSARRRGRSVATIALLASGSFVIAALGVFRLEAGRDAARRSSGTAGFNLIGSSTLPVLQDLNSEAGREFFGLSGNDLSACHFVPFRIHEGDEASCLNLNRAQKPRLLGVNPSLLAGRFTFTDAAKGRARPESWQLLSGVRQPAALDAEEVPAVGDANSIQWALGKRLGDTLEYTDERGRTFKVRLVGAVANSILQGSLIIDETEFVKRFPNESGYRFFLIDAPTTTLSKISETLSRALLDVGFEVTPAVERLNAFNAVQNTYLGTFQILGGLGLLLGSAGLGVVVLRNVLERRAELGLLLAVGFRRRTLHGLILGEHASLLAAGLGLGVLSAAVAVLPALLSPATELPYRSVGLTFLAVLLNGALWTWLATRYAIRGDLLEALRNE